MTTHLSPSLRTPSESSAGDTNRFDIARSLAAPCTLPRAGFLPLSLYQDMEACIECRSSVDCELLAVIRTLTLAVSPTATLMQTSDIM